MRNNEFRILFTIIRRINLNLFLDTHILFTYYCNLSVLRRIIVFHCLPLRT